MCVINGNDGTANGSEIIISVAHAIIKPRTLAEYSWTGKSGIKGVSKMRFDGYNQIIGLIHSVCRLADQKYALARCKYDMTYKVFKYAKNRCIYFGIPIGSKRSNLIYSFDSLDLPKLSKKDLQMIS